MLPLPLAEAVPLFTPEGERAYVPGWEPEYLHPTEPSDAAGTVFRTRAEGEETLWLVLEHHPAAGVAARLEGWREAIVGLADRNPGR